MFLIHNEKELKCYLDRVSPAYIQQYLPLDRDIRVVVIGNRIVHAYWRIAPENEYRSNVALGGIIAVSDRRYRLKASKTSKVSGTAAESA